MAKDNEDWIGTPSPLVCSVGGVRFHHPSSSREAQTHVDGLSRLPVNPVPPEDTLLHVQLLDNVEEARKLAQ